MGGEYNHEVPRRIPRDGSQNARKFEFRRLRIFRQENDQREHKGIWNVRINRNECHLNGLERFRTP